MRTGKQRGQKGSVLIVAAVTLVVLLIMMALAVDISRLYIMRQYLVNACDASALAGGMALPDQTKATTEASRCALANKMTTYQISFPTDGLTGAGMAKIRVDGHATVEYAFAGIIGLKSRMVSAYAIVHRSASVGWANNVVPWGIPFYDAQGAPYQYGAGVLYTLKMGSSTAGRVGGNFYPLALDSSLGDGHRGASAYRDDIKWGFNGPVKVGDIVDTEPGNKVGPTKQSVESDSDSLFARARAQPWTDDTWHNYDYGNPRIVVTPIISPITVNGRAKVQILGFAAFWVDSIQGQEVKGYFLNYTIPDAGGSGPDYGVSTFRLVE